ncbi:phosphatase domain-containing protein [Rubrivirga sp.]|uniref:phosphatase domain-containing protein n=1 Tax=Rubrivirga sp. TaxID=1885344 RepID=UPI003C79404A
MSVLLSALAQTGRAVDRSFNVVRRRLGLWSRVRVVLYGGYGRPGCVRLRGRVLGGQSAEPRSGAPVWSTVWRTARRFVTDDVPGARVEVTVGDVIVEATSDVDGYFEAALEVEVCPSSLWRSATARVLDPASDDDAHAYVQVPTADAQFVVVSDLDDTVLEAEAPHALRLAWRVLSSSAETRRTLPGVRTLYRALVTDDGQPVNPLVYVSDSPWDLYEHLTGALEHHGIPRGALHLRDLNENPMSWLDPDAHAHKLSAIGDVLDTYPDLDAVLIGDSGQKDPEVYQQIVARHAGRVRAVLIRHVAGPRREREVCQIARDVEMRGTAMRVFSDSAEGARAVVELGLASERAVGLLQRSSWRPPRTSPFRPSAPRGRSA